MVQGDLDGGEGTAKLDIFDDEDGLADFGPVDVFEVCRDYVRLTPSCEVFRRSA